MRSRGKTDRGIVMIIALMILSLVGAALLVLTEATSDDGLRTFDHMRQAQLEQMLLAGTTDAAARLGSDVLAAGASWEIELPPALSERGGRLEARVTSASQDGWVEMLISARLDKHGAAEQTVRFQRAGVGWRLASARLER
jgi:hypothetical protein